jgi:hypothetical protein
VRVRPQNVIIANNTEMLRQFALLGMGVAILPSYLIGNDTTRGQLVRLLGDYQLPQVEINVAYPSRRHLPAKVRTFIDHLVEHFSQTPNHQVGEQWLRDGRGRVMSAAQPAFDDHAHDDSGRSHSIDDDVGRKLSQPSRTRGRIPAATPF